MADKKPTSRYFSNLGGVNLKSSEYKTGETQWLDLRNVDFDVANSLQKRPGSTQAVAVATSGPVIGLFEYKKLTGQSFIVAGTDTALFYLAANAYTLLDSGWTNGQPQDMLTFLNKMWVANGQYFKSWDGGTSFGILPATPCPPTVLALYGATIYNDSTGFTTNPSSRFKVASQIMNTNLTNSEPVVGIYMAYSFLRSDGAIGPVDFNSTARNIVTANAPSSAGGTYQFFDVIAGKYGGLTIMAPSYGISALNVWIGVDKADYNSRYVGSVGSYVGDLGFLINKSTTGSSAINSENRDLGNIKRVPDSRFATFTTANTVIYMSETLSPTADVSRFWLLASVPGSSLIARSAAGVTFFSFFTSFGDSVNLGATYGSYSGVPPVGLGFTGSNVCLFSTGAPKYIDVNQNVMFYSGFSNAPSDVWFSEIGSPETIYSDNQFEVRTNDGDRIMGHKAYNNTVVVFKEESFHKVIGSTPEDFQLVELSTEFGALSNSAIIEYDEKLLFLDRKGIVEYDGAGWRIISNQIDEIFRRMNLSAAKEKATAVHHNYRNQVWFGIPVDGSTQNNLTVVYDYLVNAWTFFDGYNASAYAFIKGAENKPTAWRGSPSGMVYYTGESFLGDDGQGITCAPFSRFEQFEGENSTNVWRRLFLDVGAVSGLTGVINGSVFTDYDKVTVKATFSMYQNVFQSKAEMGVVGKAVAVQFSHYSASLPFLLNGYSWSKRNLRNV